MNLETGLVYALSIMVATAIGLTGFAAWLKRRDDREQNHNAS